MNGPSPFDQFLTELAAKLPPGWRGRRVLEEIETHLEDHAGRLQRGGASPSEAKLSAVRAFGSPALVCDEFQNQAPLESEVFTMFRWVLSCFLAVTIAYAGMHFIAAVFFDAPFVQRVTTAVAAAIVIDLGIYLLIFFWKDPEAYAETWWTVAAGVGALLMVALGTANMVWAAHLGIVTGDWEYYGILGGGLIALQGMLAAGWLMFRKRPLAA